MKKTLLIIGLLISSMMHSQENYQLEINGKIIDIELDKNYNIQLKNESMDVRVSAKDTLTYKDEMIGFKYPKEFKISSTMVAEGIEQLMLMTADGTGFLIQKYMTMDPSMINEIMLNEVTKESINYGFKMKREDYEKTLKSGGKLIINRAVLTYKDEVNIYEIASTGKKDEGVLLMSIKMDDEVNSNGMQLIDMMWKTLEVY